MRAWLLFGLSSILSLSAAGQPSGAPAFEVASVKPSQRQLGPDYNNQFTVSTSAFTARNATLRRLISEAYQVQARQVSGPGWLDENEYDIEARTSARTDSQGIDRMLQTLLAERFELKQHGEMRKMQTYELAAGKGGPRIRPMASGVPAASGPGFHFHGDMRRFADFVAVQLSIPIPDDPKQPGRAGGPMIPVLDKTGLQGAYDFTLDIRPEPGADSLSLWQRTLREQLGLRIESRRGLVEIVVVDYASRIPTPN